MSLKGLAIASAVIALVVAAACGETDPTSTPTPTLTPTSIPTPTATLAPAPTPIPSPTLAPTQDPEAEYIAELKSIEEKTRELFDPIEAPSREMFLRALRESNPIGELEAILEQVENITPQNGFEPITSGISSSAAKHWRLHALWSSPLRTKTVFRFRWSSDEAIRCFATPSETCRLSSPRSSSRIATEKVLAMTSILPLLSKSIWIRCS